MNIKQTLVVVLSCFTLISAIPDGYEEMFYIAEHDTAKFELSRMINFKSSSIDFSSTNQRVELPGIPNSSSMNIELKVAIDPRVVKVKENHLFVLSKDGRTVTECRISGDGKAESLSSELQKQIENRPELFCNDLLFDGQTNIYALCYNLEESKKSERQELSYTIISINFFQQAPNFVVTFKAAWFSNPCFKLVSPNEFLKKESALIIFDKGRDLKGTVELERASVLLILELAEGQQRKVKNILPLKFTVSFSKTAHIKFRNIMIRNSNQEKREVYLYMEITEGDLPSDQIVQKCEINSQHDVENGELSNCSQMFAGIKTFFLKQNDYMMIDAKDTLLFCRFDEKECSPGKIQPNWIIKDLMLEDRFAIVIMEIDKNHIFFFYDFENKFFTWKGMASDIDSAHFLINLSSENEQKHYLANLSPKKGFSLRDVTLSTIMTVRYHDVEDGKPIEITLDNEKILKLDIRQFDRKTALDKHPGKKHVVVRSKDGTFKSKLDIVGLSNGVESSMGNNIYYFNKLALRGQFTSQQSYFHGYDNKLLVFSSRKLSVRNCVFEFVHLNAECVETHAIDLPEISPLEISSVDRVSTFLVVLFKTSGKMLVFDEATFKILDVKIPENFSGNEGCKINLKYLICKTRTERENKKFDSIRIYRLTEDSLEVQHGLNNQFDDWCFSQFALSSGEFELADLEIADFSSDSVRARNLFIFFNYRFGGINKNKIHNFKFEMESINKPSSVRHLEYLKEFSENSDLKKESKMIQLDGQTLFYMIEPAFKMFSSDVESSFFFEYINTAEIIQTFSLLSHNLIGFLYREIQSQEIYFILYKVTKNAAEQTIAHHVCKFQTNPRVSLSVINAYRVAVWFYSENSEEVELKVYYDDGPFIITNSLQETITSGASSFKMLFEEDSSFYQCSIDEIQSAEINVETTSALRIDDYFTINGHLRDINLISVPGIELRKPIRELSAQEIALASPRKGFVFSSRGRDIIFEAEKPSKFVKIENGRSSTFEITGLGDSFCNDHVFSKEAFVCFWDSGVKYLVTYKPFDTAPQETFELSRGGYMSRVFANGNFLVISRVQTNHKYITIHTINRTTKTIKTQFVGRKKLRVGALKITDYHITIKRKTKEFGFIILDTIQNQLNFFRSNYNFKVRPVLKQSFSLNEYGNFYRNITCSDAHEENFHFLCNLYSDLSILTVKIFESNPEAGVPLSWKVDVLKLYKNLMYQDSLDSEYGLDDSSSKVALMLRNKHPRKGQNSMIFFDPLVASPYSYYTLTLPDDHSIISATLSENDNNLEVYYIHDGKIMFTVYLVHKYEMLVADRALSKGHEALLELKFDGNPTQNAKLVLTGNPISGKQSFDSSETFGFILVILIIITFLLLITSLFTLFYFKKTTPVQEQLNLAAERV